MSDSILLRKLTFKSTLKFGKYKDYTVDHLIGMKLQKNLISIYFKLSKITFVDEILDELGITDEYRIEKPSTNTELYYKFLFEKYGEKIKPNKKLLKLKKQTKVINKGYLQSINQGH